MDKHYDKAMKDEENGYLTNSLEFCSVSLN